MTNSDGRRHVVVIGAGPGGYPAAFRASKLGFDVTLIDPEALPGGVCLYRGCIPSKALLHAAEVMRAASDADAMGLTFGAPRVDLDRLRAWKDDVVVKQTRGLAGLTRARRVRHVQGRARFRDAHSLEVSGEQPQVIEFDAAIVATGSSPAAPEGLHSDSPFVMDSTAALAVDEVPATLLVIGGGYIGLELGIGLRGPGVPGDAGRDDAGTIAGCRPGAGEAAGGAHGRRAAGGLAGHASHRLASGGGSGRGGAQRAVGGAVAACVRSRARGGGAGAQQRRPGPGAHGGPGR